MTMRVLYSLTTSAQVATELEFFDIIMQVANLSTTRATGDYEYSMVLQHLHKVANLWDIVNS